MALSIDNPIVEADIQQIQMFKALKVWQLTDANDQKLVIKCDAIQSAQYKSSNVAIKAVDATARHKVLTANEMQELRNFVATFEQLTRDYARYWVIYHKSQAPAVADLKQSLTFGFPFIKMRAVDVTELKGAVEARLAGQKGDLQAFVTAFKAIGGLERLGEIVAVDMFNGNSDRFWPTAAKYQQTRVATAKRTHVIGGVSISARTLVNVGNVFQLNTAGGPAVGALDFVDPQSLFKDINAGLAATESGLGVRWPARLLADRLERAEFAKDIVHDLEKFLSPKKQWKTKLGNNAADRVAAGMVSGARAIKLRLEMKYNPNKWTAGATDRYLVLSAVR